ncbi:uncharacterized protein LOC108670739 isoform X2 [Hyalella azteca]|uniref:Uncharacterized protein LOC108670739 isoform X2 n=1 Tax=Hyalella azteca TaxID=294128 RepID=A0A8B7NJ94_HYAAZ|nr:uncharacterized protein LOC108670739 isoform X2 [Hyalella azteca]
METLERSGEDKAAPPEEEIEKARLKDKRLFKTKLSLNLKMPLLRRDSRSKLLRKIDEESESIILQDGQIVRLRSTSTSSSRSYNGQTHRRHSASCPQPLLVHLISSDLCSDTCLSLFLISLPYPSSLSLLLTPLT